MIHWTYKPFSLLTAEEIYLILQLRSDVFVVEQNCVYRDADDKDQDSYHLSGWADHHLVAYARILPPEKSYREASIGRVLTNPLYRRKGSGKELMQKAIELTLQQFDVDCIRIGAQLYLHKFYTELGFIQTSDTYMEDGIEHIEMLFKK